MRQITVILCLLLVTSAVRAADWTLTTIEFEKQAVALRGIDGEGLSVVTEGGGQAVSIPMHRFLSLVRGSHQDAPSGDALVLHLAGGGRLVGTPLKIEDDAIVWQARSVGAVPAPLRSAEGIARLGQPLPAGEAGALQDRIRLNNDDLLEGIIADIVEDRIILQIGADAVPVPLDTISSVQFASTGRRTIQSERGFQVRLDDGSAIFSPDVQLRAGAVLVEVGGAPRQLPLDRVRAVEQINGPVAWLSDRQPDENEQTPFIGDPVPARFNTDLDGRPIVIRDQPVSKGIAVHSYSRLTWDLEGDYPQFRTQYVIDGEREQANVTVRILLDETVVHEQGDVVAGAVSPVVEVDLSGGTQLTLEVDYGQTYDVQDRLIWIEPALVKPALIDPVE